LGSFNEPNNLKRTTLGSDLEQVGSTLARDCRNDAYANWDHDQLRHNVVELARLRELVRPILFP
jgi:hypothetical protein